MPSTLLISFQSPPTDTSQQNFQTGVATTYNLEILPYGLRAKGGVIGSFTILCALFFNQFVNPIALKNITWRYYIVYCAFLVFQCWFIWTQLIETRYTPLEEVTKFFDGDEKDIVELTNAQVKQAAIEEGQGQGDDVKKDVAGEAREVEVRRE